MGKRKERRLAAMSAAGRRVKLDLFAEPSGDSGGSSAQDELGGDIDGRHRAGSPNSPSSSAVVFLRGNQPENPLLLLGQYSDDELDEESSERLGHATAENSTAAADEEVKIPVSQESEVMENDASLDIDADKDKRDDVEFCSISPDAVQNVEDKDDRVVNFAVTGDLCKEAVSTREPSVPGCDAVSSTGEVVSSWKVVLHEESNQYYYWNTVTGETSWVVPALLVQGTESTVDHKTAPDTDGGSCVLAGVNEPNFVSDVEPDNSKNMLATDHEGGSVVHETRENYEPGALMEEQNNGYEDEGLEDTSHRLEAPDANQTDVTFSSGAATALCCNTSLQGYNVSSWESSDVPLANGNDRGADSGKYSVEDDTENDLCSSALKYGESLLGRLKSLGGSKNHMQGHDWISKYILEVEIRLFDIKSLLPFGSSLLPFWVHCERQFKELEGALDNEISQFQKPMQTCEAEAPVKSQDSKRVEIEVHGDKKDVVYSTFENAHAHADIGKSEVVQKGLENEAASSNVLRAGQFFAVDYLTAYSDSGAAGDSGGHEATQSTELTPNAVLHAGEDVDMDVDMDIEDVAPTSATITGDSLASEEQPNQPNPPPEHASFIPDEAVGVPPPPDDDWIPPPPPDDELVPPPPPDAEPIYPPPPTYSETMQPVSYVEQYNLSYPVSHFEYYGQANTEFSANNVYGHAEGSQVAVHHPPLYCEALPGTYPGVVPVVNPVESVAYYDLQNGAAFAGPVASGAQSSVVHNESAHQAGSDQIRSAEAHSEMGCTLLLESEVGGSVGSSGIEQASVEVPFTSATSAVESAPGSSSTAVNTVSVTSNSRATTVQPKVLRSKKRTVAAVSTLRSNKKVSSLVDKWKAAKEELHEEEEDEPENAYEILEKKRQREIEEWRAHQIASGEAKANANFQPLGGDWRERVKRKRAKMNIESVQTPSEESSDVNQQPDLSELSKDLPSGWQAYWDESSKQVYYGNTLTSETTWTRPAI